MYALTGNVCITIIKTIGAFLTGSASLFGEAVHSAADSMNQTLLLVGVTRSRRRADERFAYGYGSERFLWALISACGIFFLGAGVTIYHGVQALTQHKTFETPIVALIILIVSFIVEAFTLHKAYTELRQHHPDMLLFEALSYGDPVTIAVIYEDTAAVFGVVVAALGITLSYLTGNTAYDAWGSIGVGIVLAVVAVILIEKNRQFLLGKAIPEDIQDEIVEMLENDPYIEKVFDFKSEVLDMGAYRIKCEIEFNGAALIEDIIEYDDIREEYENIKDDYEEFKKFVVYHTNRVPRLIGRKIDEIEKRITTAYPQIKHLDIEIN